MDLGEPKPAPTLERLIVLWNQIQETIERKLKVAGIEHRHTFYWEEAMQAGVISGDDIRRLTELRMIRNTQVHSSDVDRKQVEHAVYLAETLLSALKDRD